jgi:hypothetical protein
MATSRARLGSSACSSSRNERPLTASPENRHRFRAFVAKWWNRVPGATGAHFVFPPGSF